MELVHPALLWGLSLASVPVAIHLLSRLRYRRIRWPAPRLLQEVVAPRRRRMRIENLLLLAVRVLLIALFCAALARPSLLSLGAVLPPSAREVVVLVDGSYSMGLRSGGRSPSDQARQFIVRTAGGLSGADRLSIFIYGDRMRRFLEPTSEAGPIEEAASNLPVFPEGSDLPAALAFAAAEVLPRLRPGPKEVYVVTDLQRRGLGLAEGAPSLGGLADAFRRHDGSVALVNVSLPVPDHAGVESLTVERRGADPLEALVTASIVHRGKRDLSSLGLRLLVDGRPQATAVVDVPSGGRAAAAFRCRFDGPGPHALAVESDPDPLAADNRRFLALDVRRRLKVLAVNGEPKPGRFADETDYLARALAPRGAGGPFEVSVKEADGFRAEDLEDLDLLILANAAVPLPVPPARLEAFVKGGGGLWIFGGGRIRAEAWNESFHRGGEGLLPFPIQGPVRRDPAKEGPVSLAVEDPDHPALAYLKERRDVTPGDARIYAYVAVDAARPAPGARVLARFTDGAVAYAEKPLGRGRTFWFGATADIEWTTLPLEPLYPVLLHLGALRLARPGAARDLRVGEPIVWEGPPEVFREPLRVADPEGATEPPSLEVTEGAGRLTYAKTDRPGIYTLERGPAGAASPLARFAVNVDPREGEIVPAAPEEVAKAYAGFPFRFVSAAPASDRKEAADARLELGPPLLLALALLLVAESCFARRVGVGGRVRDPRPRTVG